MVSSVVASHVGVWVTDSFTGLGQILVEWKDSCARKSTQYRQVSPDESPLEKQAQTHGARLPVLLKENMYSQLAMRH